MKVLLLGLGNIGTTLANVLLAQRELLGLAALRLQKGTPKPYLEADLDLLRARGAEVVTGRDLAAHGEGIDYIFDCRGAGMPLADKAALAAMPQLRGAVAQGSEHGFGVPYVTGVNDAAVRGERFVQVASCNAHAVATLLRVFAGDDLAALVRGDFVVVRRSEDIGAHERLVSGTVVSRHAEPLGTHHAAAAQRIYATRGIHVEVTSSDVTTPSQLMHTLRFSLTLRGERSAADAQAAIAREPLLATTQKFDANRLFELGRRYGVQGRLYAHAIVVANDLLIHHRDGNTEVRGWAFVPQEGNTILSTLAAFLLQTQHPAAAPLLATLTRGHVLAKII